MSWRVRTPAQRAAGARTPAERAGDAALLAVGVVILVAGCGSTAAPSRPAEPVLPAGQAVMTLAGSVATSQATWAVLPMGARSGPNQFWQLFSRAGQAGSWHLATPPDVATNGAPALAGESGSGLIAGVRPSLYLNFSPLSQTADAGQKWTAGPPAAGLADVPDALAGAPGGRQLLVLSTKGRVTTGSLTSAAWHPVTTTSALAATAAGRACGLTSLTAVADTAADVALVAGDCARPGVAGIFARSGTSFSLAGPPLPAAFARAPVRVLRLLSAGTQTVALLQAGTGQSAALLAGWRDAAGTWTLSEPLKLAGSTVRSSAFGAAGSAGVLLWSGRGAVIAGPGSGWRPMPSVPGGQAAALALPATGQPEALTATGAVMTVWRLAASGAAWSQLQTVRVPIQYGSSS